MTLKAYIDSLKLKRVCVLGIGVSNTPLIELLAGSGVRLQARDKRGREFFGETADRLEALGVQLVLGADYLDNLDADVIFRTPGMHPHTPQLAAAQSRGALVTSEMEAFFAVCPCRTIAVTGSDGKTTTSSIIAELLRAAGHTVHLGGNIGHPLLTEADAFGPGDVAVLELSSFQLHSMSCSPDVALVTNISPNHLDVHPTLEDYVDAKRSIYRGQKPGSVLVLNRDNPSSRVFAEDASAEVLFFSRRESVKNGVFLSEDMIYSSDGYQVELIMPASEILLPGLHNAENYMAAFCAVRGLVTPAHCRAVARTYAGVEHRLELIRSLNGVRYINDSIASSPTRTIAGLRSFAAKPILIAGGYDKRIPFDKLGREICERVKALFLTGDTAEQIRQAVVSAPNYEPESLPIVMLEDFRETVLAAASLAEDGDTVLLSPACASFDKFDDFAQRGNVFRDIVLSLED